MKNGHVIGIVAIAAASGLILGHFAKPRHPRSEVKEEDCTGKDCPSLGEGAVAGPHDHGKSRWGTQSQPQPQTQHQPQQAPRPQPTSPPRQPPPSKGGCPSGQCPDSRSAAQMAPPRAVPGQRYQVDVFPDDPSKGPTSAPVTVVVFSNFQCGFCGRVVPTLARIRNEYRNEVRIVFKHHPFPGRPEGELAHIASAEANSQGKFWEYHDRIFQKRGVQRSDLEAHAQALGMDMRRFRAALDSQSHKAHIARTVAQARGLGATGTPAFFINGIFLSGARPFEAFKPIIDSELGRN